MVGTVVPTKYDIDTPPRYQLGVAIRNNRKDSKELAITGPEGVNGQHLIAHTNKTSDD